jgi:hypothetical protein
MVQTITSAPVTARPPSSTMVPEIALRYHCLYGKHPLTPQSIHIPMIAILLGRR